MRHSCALVYGNRREHFIGRVEIFAHDRRLILQHGQEQRKTNYVQLFVAQIQTIIAWYVAQQVHLPVQVRYGAYFAAHIVVETIERIGVNEAIAHPNARLYRLVYLVQYREGVFDAIFGHELRIFSSFGQTLGVVLQNVKAILVVIRKRINN